MRTKNINLYLDDVILNVVFEFEDEEIEIISVDIVSGSMFDFLVFIENNVVDSEVFDYIEEKIKVLIEKDFDNKFEEQWY